MPRLSCFCGEKITLYKQAPGFWCLNQPIEISPETSRFNLQFWGDDGELAAEIKGFTIKRAPEAAMLANAGASSVARYQYAVEHKELEAPAATDLGAVTLVAPAVSALGDTLAQVLCASCADLSRVTDFPSGGFKQIQTVICVWNGGDEPAAAHRQAEAALQQVHLLQGREDLSNLKLVWVSDGLDLAAATVMGLGRVVQNEIADLDLQLIQSTNGSWQRTSFQGALALADEPGFFSPEIEVRV